MRSNFVFLAFIYCYYQHKLHIKTDWRKTRELRRDTFFSCSRFSKEKVQLQVNRFIQPIPPDKRLTFDLTKTNRVSHASQRFHQITQAMALSIIAILFIYLFIYLFVCLFVYLFVCLFIYLFVCLFIYLFVYLFVCLFICLYVYLFTFGFFSC